MNNWRSQLDDFSELINYPSSNILVNILLTYYWTYRYIDCSFSELYIYISIYYAEHHPWTENPLLKTRTWNDRWLVWLLEWVCPILGYPVTPVVSHGFSSFRLFSSIKSLPFFFRTDPMLGQTRSVFDTENQIISDPIFALYFFQVSRPMDKIVGDVNGEIIWNDILTNTYRVLFRFVQTRFKHINVSFSKLTWTKIHILGIIILRHGLTCFEHGSTSDSKSNWNSYF